MNVNLKKEIIFIYGGPRTGKTHLAASFPGHLLITFSRGGCIVPGAMVAPVSEWNNFINYIEQLEQPAAQNMYNFVCLDNLEDFISSYKNLRTVEEELNTQIDKIHSMGYGVILLSNNTNSTLFDNERLSSKIADHFIQEKATLSICLERYKTYIMKYSNYFCHPINIELPQVDTIPTKYENILNYMLSIEIENYAQAITCIEHLNIDMIIKYNKGVKFTPQEIESLKLLREMI